MARRVRVGTCQERQKREISPLDHPQVHHGRRTEPRGRDRFGRVRFVLEDKPSGGAGAGSGSWRHERPRGHDSPDDRSERRRRLLLNGHGLDRAGSEMTIPDRLRDIYDRSVAAKESIVTRDVALLGARVALAWIFIYHGAGTLFGAFGGTGIHRGSIFYATVAHLHPATFFTVLGGIIECFGGIAVGVGIFGRLAAAGLVGDMAVAMATVTFANGIVSNRPGAGYELNLALAALAFVVALLGTGRLSLDTVLRAIWERHRTARIEPGGTLIEVDTGELSYNR